MDIKSNILQTINERKSLFQKHPYDMISAYNREIETEKEYNGRQLLELLQNADDEKSDEVMIKLNTKENLLQISNRGKVCKPFSYEGIRSLMISNLSSKTTKRFIGNKGLGFRSIINWSKQVTINSNNLDIIFSREIVSKIYNELFDISEHKQFSKERNLPLNVKPIPFLSIPKVEENIDNQWTTTISIIFKPQFLSDIQKQLHELKEEILLFLNCLKKLIVIVNDEKILDVRREDLTDRYTIYQKREKLPFDLWEKENEEEYFDLKIALQEDLNNEVDELFSYFPTKIDIKFPFIVHGTFELNSSRNQINDSRKNRFILEKLVELIVETAKKITKNEVSYKALEMLTYTYEDHILKELGFYTFIDQALENLEVFPCLDNTYRNKKDVNCINELSIYVKKTNNIDIFPNLLIPNNSKLDLSKYALQSSTTKEKLNLLSQNIKDLDQRVELIYMFYNTFKHQDKLEFLIDKNMNIISLEDDVFTPSSLELDVPNFVNVKFIHPELFKKLIKKFGITSSEHKSRDLQVKLKEITNVEEYAFLPILRKIINSTNKQLNNHSVDKRKLIKDVVQSLYFNYVLLDKKVNIPNDIKIKLINKAGTLSDVTDMYLSKTYPLGQITEYLFAGIFSDEELLGDLEIYEFENEDVEDVEEFFLWLGVNKYTKFSKKSYDPDYINFVFNKVEKPINYRDSSFEVKAIIDFARIAANISKEKLILWFMLDESLYSQLDYSNDDIFKYSKDRESYGYYRHTLHKKPSYILYQIVTKQIFNNYLVGNEKLNHIVNNFQINFEFEGFKKYNKSKPDIESLLLKIGAVDKFEKLSINSLTKIVKNLPINSPDGKNAQTVYRLCMKHYEKNKQSLMDKDVKLFAKKLGDKKYFDLKDVFYTDIKLPVKVTETKAILDYPKRQSVINIIKFFGVNNLKSVQVDVSHQDTLDEVTKKFKKHLERINEYILVYRIKDIESDQTAYDMVRKLKKLDIKLCSNVQYDIEGQNFNLDFNDYIFNNSSYLIKINSTNSLEQIQSTFEFQESFADIVGLVFDIQETEIFRQIIKEEPAYIEKTITNDIGREELIRARELLGKSDEKMSFWTIVFSLIGKDSIFLEKDNLLKSIKNQLNLQTEIEQIDYLHLNSYSDCKLLIQLFIELNLTIEDYNNKEPFYSIDCYEYHCVNLKQAFEDNYYFFQKQIYAYCVQTEQESKFNDFKASYNHNDAYIEREATINKNTMNINYIDIVKKFVENSFDLNEVEPTKIDFISIYEENSNQIDLESLHGNNEYISLLYFDGKIEKVKIEVQNDLTNKNEQHPNETSSPNVTSKPILDSELNTPNQHTISRQQRKKPYKYNSQKEVSQKERGNKSELDVYLSLVKEYGRENVFRESNDDDSLGYDIKYKNKNGIWKYAEVKTFNGTQFNLTKNEKEFAQSHIGFYELFLVSGDNIYKIENIDYLDKNRFKLVENDYIVKYILK